MKLQAVGKRGRRHVTCPVAMPCLCIYKDFAAYGASIAKETAENEAAGSSRKTDG
jgi:hypothetical protein